MNLDKSPAEASPLENLRHHLQMPLVRFVQLVSDDEPVVDVAYALHRLEAGAMRPDTDGYPGHVSIWASLPTRYRYEQALWFEEQAQ